MGSDGTPQDSSRRKHRRSSERYEDEEGEVEAGGSKARKHHRHHHHRRHRDRGHCSKDERGEDGEAELGVTEAEEDGEACPAAATIAAAAVAVRPDLDDEMEEGEILDDEEGVAPVDSEHGKIELEGVDSNSNHLATSKEDNPLLEKDENSHCRNLNAIQEETKEEVHDKNPEKPHEIHSENGKLVNFINQVEVKELSRGSGSRKFAPEDGEYRMEAHPETNVSSSQLFLDGSKADYLNMEVRDSERREYLKSESRYAENKISMDKESSHKRKQRDEVDCKTSDYDLERHKYKRRSASRDVHRNILDNNEGSVSPCFEDKYKTRELSPSYKHYDDTLYRNRSRSDTRPSERSCEDRANSSNTRDKYRNDSDYERGATSVRLDRGDSKSKTKESEKEKVARREREHSRSHGRHAREDRHGSRDRDMEKDRGRSRDRDRDQIANTTGERERGRSRDRDREKTTDTTRENERGRSRNKHRERTVDTVRERDRDKSRDRDRAKAIDTHRERDKGRDRDSVRLGDAVRERERERDGNGRVRDRELRKEHDRESRKERDKELEHRERDRPRARNNHDDLRYSEYDKSYYYTDKTKSKEYSKQSSLKNQDYKEEKEKPVWDEDEEDYQGKIEEQLSKQEEEDPEKIIEESRRRRLAILEKYKQLQQQNSPQVSEPLSDSQGKETSARTPEESPKPGGFARDQVATEAIEGANDNADVFVMDTSFSIGKSPQPNGTSTLEKTIDGGLGHGTPKSERSADMFCDDIFGESPTSVRKVGKEENVVVERSGLHDNWDDAEGYYSYRFGEVLDGRYEILAAHGKGVFSTVVRAKDLKAGKGDPEEVAIKIIRNNETMYKAGLEELVILKKLAGADPEDRRHCVRFLSSFKYRNHLCLVFESLHMNLREVLKKFGRNIGLKLTAVRAYAKQLFIALKHLRNCGVLHSDIKPDNMLVNEAKNVLKLCDFGNAMFAGKNEITPYLVSRFYRAPEIILGLSYDHPIDMWSVGCCLFELYNGKVLFPGPSNNDMLRLHMELKGPFPKKMLRKGEFTNHHFDQDLNFLANEEDPVTKKPVKRLILNLKPKSMDAIITSFPEEDPKLLSYFKDLLERMFVLDPEKRLTVSQALNHSFITGK